MNGANTLWYRRPAACFNEALPLGNGRLGACVYGGVKAARFSLNEDTLWSGYPRSSQESCAAVYRQARQLALEERFREAEELLEQRFGDFLVQMYLPLGDLCIEMEHGDAARDYRRELSLETAVHTVSYRVDGRAYTRECFVSHPAQVLAIRIACDRAGSVGFTARLSPKLRARRLEEGGAAYIDGYCPVCLAPYGHTYGSDAEKLYADADEEKGVGYRAGLKVVAAGGTVAVSGAGITVAGADEAVVYVAVRTSFNGPFRHPVTDGRPYREPCAGDLEAAAQKGFEALRADSVADYRRLYARVSLDLGGGEAGGLPTDERLVRHARGERGDNALYTLLFNFGRYLTIAASRTGTQPMNLQGLWNEELTPPWNCNYTLNINTEMNYWPTLGCGLFECYEPLVTLTKELCQAGRSTARRYYGAEGFVSHHATDLWRVTHPSTNRLEGSTQWGQWCLSGGWLTVMLVEYYRYTGDKGYLREIYPVIRDCAAFYQSLLVQQEGGWILCPSTSPENRYRTADGSQPLDKTTAMTMQILRDVFSCACAAARELGEDPAPYADTLARLAGCTVLSDGTLNEWYAPHEDWEVHHRHVSHLYGLYPSHQFGGNPALRAACRKSLEKRGDGGTGWSLAWKVNLWAMLGDGERALRLLDRQLHPVDSRNEEHDAGGGSYPNLLCAHPPFQIDGNFGACAGILHMLVQPREDAVELLPALPEAWRDGELTGVYLPGRKRLDIQWRDGRVTRQRLYDWEGEA